MARLTKTYTGDFTTFIAKKIIELALKQAKKKGKSTQDVEDDDVVSTIAVETAALQKAVDGTVRGLSELNSNISDASKATASIKVPTDMEKNTDDFNKGLSSASSNIQEVAKVLHNLKETVAAFETVNMPEGLGEELEKMKNTVKELNAKYEAMLGAMNK